MSEKLEYLAWYILRWRKNGFWGCFTYNQVSTSNLCTITSSPNALFGSFSPDIGDTVTLITITQWLTITQGSTNFKVTDLDSLTLVSSGPCQELESVVPLTEHVANFDDNKKIAESAVLNSSDFHFHAIIYQQHFLLGVATETLQIFWGRGQHNRLVLGTSRVVLTVEESFNMNEVVFSSQGSYIRAANHLPYVVLEFGSTRRTATSFQITFITSSTIMLSTADTKGNGVHTWVRNGNFVYLFKGPPSDHRTNTNAIFTVSRNLC